MATARLWEREWISLTASSSRGTAWTTRPPTKTRAARGETVVEADMADIESRIHASIKFDFIVFSLSLMGKWVDPYFRVAHSLLKRGVGEVFVAEPLLSFGRTHAPSVIQDFLKALSERLGFGQPSTDDLISLEVIERGIATGGYVDAKPAAFYVLPPDASKRPRFVFLHLVRGNKPDSPQPAGWLSFRQLRAKYSSGDDDAADDESVMDGADGGAPAESAPMDVGNQETFSSDRDMLTGAAYAQSRPTKRKNNADSDNGESSLGTGKIPRRE
eukprot:Opistho-2@63235